MPYFGKATSHFGDGERSAAGLEEGGGGEGDRRGEVEGAVVPTGVTIKLDKSGGNLDLGLRCCSDMVSVPSDTDTREKLRYSGTRQPASWEMSTGEDGCTMPLTARVN